MKHFLCTLLVTILITPFINGAQDIAIQNPISTFLNNEIDLYLLDSTLHIPAPTIEKVIQLHSKSFGIYNNENLKKDSTYWLRINFRDKPQKDIEYYIHFNNMVSDIELYQTNIDSLYSMSKGGTLIPLSQRTVKRHIKDLVPFIMLSNNETIIYLKIKNQLSNNNIIENINIVTENEFEIQSADINLVQGGFLGILLIILVFNFISFIFTQNYIYLLYAFYITLTALFLANTFEITERFFFANYPKFDMYVQWAYLLAQCIYLLFFIELLKIENQKRWRKGTFWYATIMLIFLFIIFTKSIQNYNNAMILCDLYSITNSVFVIFSFLTLFQKVKLTTKIILVGALFTVMGALVTIILSFNKVFTHNLLYFQIGIFVELILFTIAINYTYTQDNRHNLLLISKQEDENRSLIVEINDTHRALATKSLMIQEKETLLTNLIGQLSAIDTSNNSSIKIKSVITGLKQNLNHSTWSEVEMYFNKVHPKFYLQLHEKLPNITPNERKLCAFLKLNLSTKEIATITGKSVNTIDVARSRLRKKVGLENADNLQTFIANIN